MNMLSGGEYNGYGAVDLWRHCSFAKSFEPRQTMLTVGVSKQQLLAILTG
jgi:hypothetical protein